LPGEAGRLFLWGCFKDTGLEIRHQIRVVKEREKPGWAKFDAAINTHGNGKNLMSSQRRPPHQPSHNN